MACNWQGYLSEPNAEKMDKATKIWSTASGYYALWVVNLGYWIETAEERPARDAMGKIGKHALVIAKHLLFK